MVSLFLLIILIGFPLHYVKSFKTFSTSTSSFLSRYSSRDEKQSVFSRWHRVNLAVDSEPSTITSEPSTTSKLFDWENQWYPIAVEKFLDKKKPHPAKLLGKDLVIWFDGNKWNVFEDYCPHRLVPLSEGRVEKNGKLLCAYHAWEFDDDGKCTRMPQADSPAKERQLCKNEKSCARVHPVRYDQGLIWCWGKSGGPGSDAALAASLKQPHLIEELEDPEIRKRIALIIYDIRDLPYGWDYFMENTLDPTHVVVSHHGRGGSRYLDPKPLNITRVPSRTEIPVVAGGEFNEAYPEDIGFKFRCNPVNNRFDSHTMTDFRPPCLNKINNVRKDGGQLGLAAYCVPTMPGHCRHILATMIIAGKKSKWVGNMGLYSWGKLVPHWLSHLVSNLFIVQDMVFLHKQERKVTSNFGYAFGRFPEGVNVTSNARTFLAPQFLPNNQDVSLNALRNWISTKAQGGPIWAKDNAKLPDVLPPEQLFNVYEMHTKNCVVCQQTVRNLRALRSLIIIAGTIAPFVLYPKKGLLGLVPSGLAALSTLWLNKLIRRFFYFEFSHQDNN
eukprot:gene268-287_t